MQFRIMPEQTSSLEYETYRIHSQSSLSVFTLMPDEWMTINSRDIVGLSRKGFLVPLLLPDILSVDELKLESMVETAIPTSEEVYENALLEDLLTEDYVIKMPAIKKVILKLSIKQVAKPEPFV